MLRRVRALYEKRSLTRQMAPDDTTPSSLRPVRKATPSTVARYWERLMAAGPVTSTHRDHLADPRSLTDAQTYSRNIENFIGTVKVPVGVIGPMRVNGLNASGDYHVPMATTEAALVASYARGAVAASRSGGISTALHYEGVIRTPAFRFADLLTAGRFVE